MDEIIIISVCLVLNALFAAYEMAFVSLPRSELRSMAKGDNKVAKKLLRMRDNPERTLSIIQIGITLVGAIAAAVGGSGASENLAPYLMQALGFKKITADFIAVIMVVIPITYLSVVIGELVPKTLALRAPKKIVLKGAKALFAADKILSPVITVLEWSTKKILNIFFRKSRANVDNTAGGTTLEIDELSPVHQSFVLNMYGIEKRKIKDIMLPWDQVNHVKETDSIEVVTQAVVKSGHTRLPVTENGHVVGVLHTKEFVTLKESGEMNWQTIIRPALKVLPNDSAFRVLRLMQEKRNHMTVVFSPEGKRLGIVTLEDILEEIVGDIYDEDDDGKVRKIFATKFRSKYISG